MSRFVALAFSLALLLPLVGCGGQNSQPQEGPPPAATGETDAAAAKDEQPFDPTAIEGEAVPPMFDPALGEGAAGQPNASGSTDEVVPVPGPIAQGRLEAPAIAKIVVVENGQPIDIAQDLPMLIAIWAAPSDRGTEILASLATPEPKSEGGFRYFTASTGGNPPQVPPAPGHLVQAGTDDTGNWHYGLMQGGVQVGLFNTLDLATKKKIPIFPEQAAPPDSTPVDQFDCMLDSNGIATVTAAGQLPDGRRLVITATSTEPVHVNKAIAEGEATKSDDGATKSE